MHKNSSGIVFEKYLSNARKKNKTQNLDIFELDNLTQDNTKTVKGKIICQTRHATVKSDITACIYRDGFASQCLNTLESGFLL